MSLKIKDAIRCKCIAVQQPVGTFYVAKMLHQDLIDITFVDVRRIEHEERAVESVLGIQRPLSPARVREISEYVNTIDASFPSGVILEIDSYDEEDNRNVYYDEGGQELLIRRDQRVAKVLDGQHRIEGLRGLLKQNEPFEVVVTIFVDADIEEQALIFATINKTQTKVNKSLVYDLLELAKNRSPEKTCHNIAILLNQRKESPFFGRIKILGTADDAAKETLTQATFVEALLRYISNEPMSDRDFLKRNPSKKLPPDTNPSPRLFLRDWFRNDEDARIAKLIINYFGAVQERWPSAWDSVDRGLILNRTTGFLALMRFMYDAYMYLDEPLPDQSRFYKVFERVKLKDQQFTKEEFIPGSSGQRALYEALKAGVG